MTDAAPPAGTGTGEPLERQIERAIASTAQGWTSNTLPGDLMCGTSGGIIQPKAAAAAVMAVVQPALEATRQEALEKDAEIARLRDSVAYLDARVDRGDQNTSDALDELDAANRALSAVRELADAAEHPMYDGTLSLAAVRAALEPKL